MQGSNRAVIGVFHGPGRNREILQNLCKTGLSIGSAHLGERRSAEEGRRLEIRGLWASKTATTNAASRFLLPYCGRSQETGSISLRPALVNTKGVAEV
jgi:hypothetical protein